MAVFIVSTNIKDNNLLCTAGRAFLVEVIEVLIAVWKIQIAHHQLKHAFAMHHSFFERIDHIKGLSAFNGLQMPAHAKGYALKNGPRTLFNQFEFEMFALAPYHLTGTVVKNPSCNKKGLGVTGTKRLHALEPAVECAVDVLEFDLGIDIQARHLLHRLDVRLHPAFKTRLKGRQIFMLHDQSHRIHMSPKGHQQIAARLHGGIHVKTIDTACRAGNQALTLSKNYSRAVIMVGQPRSHNAYHPLVPVGLKKNCGTAFLQVGTARQHFQGFLGGQAVQIFAGIVLHPDVAAHHARQLLIFTDEQLHGIAPRFDATGSIDAWTNLKYNIRNFKFLMLHVGIANDAVQTNTRSRIELFQAIQGHDPVLPTQQGNVGGYAHRHQVEIRIQLRLGIMVVATKGLHKLKTNTATGQFFIRIRTIFSSWIKAGYSRRQNLARRMVIANNKVDAEFLGIGHLIHRLNAAIE